MTRLMKKSKAEIQREYRKTPKGKFGLIKQAAKQRGIPFLLSFEEWHKFWLDSGHWEERGRSEGKYNMCRCGDTGAYELNNIYIALHTQNTKDAQKNGKMSFPRKSGRKGKRYVPLELQKQKRLEWQRNRRNKKKNEIKQHIT